MYQLTSTHPCQHGLSIKLSFSPDCFSWESFLHFFLERYEEHLINGTESLSFLSGKAVHHITLSEHPNPHIRQKYQADVHCFSWWKVIILSIKRKLWPRWENHTLNKKSLNGQGKSMVMVLQGNFLVQWRNFYDFDTTVFYHSMAINHWFPFLCLIRNIFPFEKGGEVNEYIVTCQAHRVLVKKANQMCGSFLFKDPRPRVLSLPERFVGDPASLARDNIYSCMI